MKSLHPWVQGKPPIENEVDRRNTFSAMLLTDGRTDGHTHTQSDRNKPLAGFNYTWLLQQHLTHYTMLISNIQCICLRVAYLSLFGFSLIPWLSSFQTLGRTDLKYLLQISETESMHIIYIYINFNF